MTQTKPRRQPDLQTDAAAQEVDTVHEGDITTPDIGMQAELITPHHNAARHNWDVKTGELIRDARLRRGLNQTDLARLLKVRQSAVSYWERGRLPDLENRIRISAMLGIPLRDLMPEVDAIPDKALESAQVRRLVDNFLALDEASRGLVDVLAQHLREKGTRES